MLIFVEKIEKPNLDINVGVLVINLLLELIKALTSLTLSF